VSWSDAFSYSTARVIIRHNSRALRDDLAFFAAVHESFWHKADRGLSPNMSA
jgi:hypothetical protein